MITKAGISITVLAVLCFGASFLWTVSTQSQDVTVTPPTAAAASPLACCFDMEPEQAESIAAQDPTFTQDLRILRGRFQDAQTALVAAFEMESATDEEIRSRVEAAIEAHNKLERRMANYIIKVRSHLTPCQQKRLFGLCAQNIRECGKRWGGRGSGCDGGKTPEGACGGSAKVEGLCGGQKCGQRCGDASTQAAPKGQEKSRSRSEGQGCGRRGGQGNSTKD